jgi:hypothetical protein
LTTPLKLAGHFHSSRHLNRMPHDDAFLRKADFSNMWPGFDPIEALQRSWPSDWRR